MLDKFLNFSFKFGKIFTVILLILFLLSMLSAGIFAFSTFKKIDLNIPTFQEIYANIEAVKSSQTNTDNAHIEPYILKINDIAKKYLSDYGKNLLTQNVKEVDDEYKMDYLNGFEEAINQTLAFGKEKNMNQKQSTELFESIVTSYDSYFQRNIHRKEVKELKQKTERLIALSTVSSSILLFILCLIIPLLIKIEENTRK